MIKVTSDVKDKGDEKLGIQFREFSQLIIYHPLFSYMLILIIVGFVIVYGVGTIEYNFHHFSL